jgi:single-stranded DNA-binding protein
LEEEAMEREQRSEPRRVVVWGTVINTPQLRGPLSAGEHVGLHVAYLVVAAKTAVEDGNRLGRAGERGTFTVPLFGDVARETLGLLKAGKEVVVSGEMRLCSWRTKAGEARVDRVIEKARVELDRKIEKPRFTRPLDSPQKQSLPADRSHPVVGPRIHDSRTAVSLFANLIAAQRSQRVDQPRGRG